MQVSMQWRLNDIYKLINKSREPLYKWIWLNSQHEPPFLFKTKDATWKSVGCKLFCLNKLFWVLVVTININKINRSCNFWLKIKLLKIKYISTYFQKFHFFIFQRLKSNEKAIHKMIKEQVQNYLAQRLNYLTTYLTREKYMLNFIWAISTFKFHIFGCITYGTYVWYPLFTFLAKYLVVLTHIKSKILTDLNLCIIAKFYLLLSG